MKKIKPSFITLPNVHIALIGSPLLYWEVCFMPIDKVCAVCGNVFKVKPSHFDKRFCCCKECQNINQKNKIGELNNNYKGGAKVRICLFCKKEYIHNNPYRKSKYCSISCFYKSNVGHPISEKSLLTFANYVEIKKQNSKVNPDKVCICGNKKDTSSVVCIRCFKEMQKRKISKVCPNCNEKFTAIPVLTYCSKKCFKEHLKTKYLRENNPNWDGGVKSENQIGRFSVDYVIWRNAVFERDKYTCCTCGKVGNKLHAHHVKKWSKFKELRYSVDNGLTLCEKCHKKIHFTNLTLFP